MKKLITCLLGLSISLAFMPIHAQNNTDQIVDDGSHEVAEFNEDGVRVSKVLTPTEDENYFDITLQIDTINEITQSGNAAVMVVLDISNSMSNNQRMDHAKEAAKKFIQAYASQDSLGDDHRLGFVTFNSNASIPVNLELQKVDESNVDKMMKTVDKIHSTHHNDIRYTNIEGGLMLAASQLEAVESATHKYIILITDGFPTTYTKDYTYQDGMMNNATGYNVDRNRCTNNSDLKDGNFCDLVTMNKMMACSGTSYSDTAAIKAEIAATMIKEEMGINIFSVGIQIGSQTIQSYIDNGRKMKVGIVESRTSNIKDFAIEDSEDGYIDWLENTIGGGKDLEDHDSQTYHNGNDLEELENAYDQLLEDVVEINTKFVEDAWVVSDPIGQNTEILAFYDKNQQLTSSLDGLLSNDNQVSYDEDKDSINWDLKHSIRTVEIEEGIEYYHYHLKYRIRLTNESTSFIEDMPYQTNHDASLSYHVVINGIYGPKETIDFHSPQVKGYVSDLSFIKTNDSNQPLKDAQFTLIHDPECSLHKIYPDSIHDLDENKLIYISNQSIEDGIITFLNIPSGHDYILKETMTPMHHIPSSDHSVRIAYDKSYLDEIDASNADIKIINTPITYQETIPVRFNIEKQYLTMTEQEFFFELKDEDNRVLDTISIITEIHKDEKLSKGSSSFKEIELGVGTHYFTISESNKTKYDIDYDDTIFDVVVTIHQVLADQFDIPLEAHVAYYKDDLQVEHPIFVNTRISTPELPREIHQYPDLQIIKKDSETDKVMEGIEFILKDEDGKFLSKITDSKGIIKLNNLKEGKYSLYESKTIQDYQLDPTIYTILVSQDHKIKEGLTTTYYYDLEINPDKDYEERNTTLTIYNKPIQTEKPTPLPIQPSKPVPPTGINMSLWSSLSLLSLLSLIILKNKQKSRS